MPPHQHQKLTKKERIQQRKDAAEERRRRIQMNQLSREVKYGKVTVRKREQSWVQLVTKIALKRFKVDLDFALVSFEWTTDIKNFAISKFVDELNKAHEQQFMEFQLHNEKVTSMLQYFKRSLDELKQDYEKSKRKFTSYYGSQFNGTKENFRKQKFYINDLISRFDDDQDTFNRETMIRYIFTMESFNLSNYAKYDRMEVSLDKKMANIWEKANHYLDAYFEKYRNLISIFKVHELDFALTESIVKSNVKKTIYLKSLLQKLNDKIENLKNDIGTKVQNLTDNRDEFKYYLFMLKSKIMKDRETDEAKRRILVSTASETIDKFKNAVRKGEQILKILGIIERFESWHLMGTYVPYPVDASPYINLDGSIPMPDDTLRNFYRKVGFVDTSRLALMEEKKVLEMENQLLRRKLGSYCVCLNCPAELQMKYLTDQEKLSLKQEAKELKSDSFSSNDETRVNDAMLDDLLEYYNKSNSGPRKSILEMLRRSLLGSDARLM